MYNNNERRYGSSGNGGARFEQGQGYQQAKRTTDFASFNRMDNRRDSCRSFGYQGRQQPGYNCERYQENERRTECRGGYQVNSRPNFESNRCDFNQRQKHRSEYKSTGYNNGLQTQPENRFQSEKCVERRDDWTKKMNLSGLPVSPTDSDSQSDDGSSTESLGKAFSFEEMLKSVEEFRKLDWSEEVEKEYAQQQLEKKRAEFFSKAAFIMQPRTENPVWEIKKRSNLKPIEHYERTWRNYIHYG